MHNSASFALDPRLASLRQAIPDLGESNVNPAAPRVGEYHAAVSLVLRAGREIDVLLIRRAEAEGDPWSGHMALPGGRRDRLDESLLQTAIRETLEETGVGLNEGGVPLGPLAPLVPSTRRLPPISIFPFVFGVPEGTRARAASPEVDEVIWTPILYLQSPQAGGTVEIPIGDDSRSFPCLRVGERVIWGLTYRILQDFFRVIREGAARPIVQTPPPTRR
jgi:8-oxo-dGTP pyrophosphatase MutT (NUDIX family)